MTKHNVPHGNIPDGIAGVYALICDATGDKYAGSSINIRRRAKEHYNDMRRNDHDNEKIQRLHDLYGFEAFRFEILEEVEDKETRLDVEQRYIDDPAFTLNECPSARGSYFSKATKDKQSAAQKGRKLTPELAAKFRSYSVGSNSYRYQGDYVTPFGKFESRDLAAAAVPNRNLSDVSIRTWCCDPDKQISKIAYGKSPFLNTTYPRDIIGKTYRDLGFYFIPKAEG